MEASSTSQRRAAPLDDIEYTQLSAQDRLASVRGRIRDLEVSHNQITLRISMPSPNDVITEQDRTNKSQLEASLEKLHALEAQLASEVES